MTAASSAAPAAENSTARSSTSPAQASTPAPDGTAEGRPLLEAADANAPGDEGLAALAQMERFFEMLAASLAAQTLQRLVLGKPKGAGDLRQISARPLMVRGEACLQIVWHHQTRDITKNPPLPEALSLLRELLGQRFMHAHVFTSTENHQLLLSKRGKVSWIRQPAGAAKASSLADSSEASAHNREKRRPLSLSAPFLHDLGVTDAQGRLVPAMARKWKQINKFVEVLSPALDRAGLPATGADGQPLPVAVVDFGAGKGYLTFALHHHLSHSRGWSADVRGVELREDLVNLCNAAVARRDLNGLAFICGDVRSHLPERLDVMVALHACDTATDFALHTGIRAGAQVIVCSPCCHKQLRPQMALPEVLKGMLQHGIHLGQQAEMVTDSLRALLLEREGYEAQVFEFVALEHSQKNKMILATRRRRPSRDAAQETTHRAGVQAQIDALKQFYGVKEQCLEVLLAG